MLILSLSESTKNNNFSVQQVFETLRNASKKIKISEYFQQYFKLNQLVTIFKACIVQIWQMEIDLNDGIIPNLEAFRSFCCFRYVYLDLQIFKNQLIDDHEEKNVYMQFLFTNT